MLKISKMTDYAVVVLGSLAGGAAFSAADLGRQTGLPVTTVAKVLKLLARGELVISARGAAGGYKLQRAAMDISVADIIAVIDGPIRLTTCVTHATATGLCSRIACGSRGRWDAANRAVIAALSDVTLADMTARPTVTLPLTGETGAVSA